MTYYGHCQPTPCSFCTRNSRPATASRSLLPNEGMSPLFEAVIEATEEPGYNSLFRATTVTGQGHTVEALPLGRTLDILRKYGTLPPTPPR